MPKLRPNDLWDIAAALRREAAIAQVDAETEEASGHETEARKHYQESEQHTFLADALELINRRQTN